LKYSLSAQDFKIVYNNSKKMNTGDILFMHSNTLKNAGVGFLVSKKYGNAVKRNLFKRRCRSLYIQCDFKNKKTSLIIRPLIQNINYTKLNNHFKELLKIVT
tara:strand:- start:310 stop:615 length:306 start_codon:yes stop_codon:yes gene_type:complete